MLTSRNVILVLPKRKGSPDPKRPNFYLLIQRRDGPLVASLHFPTPRIPVGVAGYFCRILVVPDQSSGIPVWSNSSQRDAMNFATESSGFPSRIRR